MTNKKKRTDREEFGEYLDIPLFFVGLAFFVAVAFETLMGR